MKRSIFTLLFTIVTIFTASSQIQLGVGGQLWLDPVTDFGAQARVLVGASEKVDIKGQSSYLFDASRLIFDFDAQYRLLNIGESGMLSPIAGLNVFFGDNGGVSLNLGANLDLIISDRKFYIEPKFIIDNVTGFVISGGIYL